MLQTAAAQAAQVQAQVKIKITTAARPQCTGAAAAVVAAHFQAQLVAQAKQA
jgi:hypothetical protein